MTKRIAGGVTYWVVRILCHAMNIFLYATPFSASWMAEPIRGWGIWIRDSRPDPLGDPRGRVLKKLSAIGATND